MISTKAQIVRLFVLKKCIYLSYPIHMFGTSVGSEHREDPCATTDIQDDFILEYMLVVVHGVPVRQCPHLIFQHLLFELETKVRFHICGK